MFGHICGHSRWVFRWVCSENGRKTRQGDGFLTVRRCARRASDHLRRRLPMTAAADGLSRRSECSAPRPGWASKRRSNFSLFDGLCQSKEDNDVASRRLRAIDVRLSDGGSSIEDASERSADPTTMFLVPGVRPTFSYDTLNASLYETNDTRVSTVDEVVDLIPRRLQGSSGCRSQPTEAGSSGRRAIAAIRRGSTRRSRSWR